MAKSKFLTPTPMETYSTYLKEFGLAQSHALVYSYFNSSYFEPAPDMKTGIAYTYKGLIPGRIFTYKYDPKYKDVLDFYDTRPIMLCIKEFIHPNTKNYLQLGINLNFLPQEIRIWVLETIFKAYRKWIEFDIRKRLEVKRGVGRITPIFTDSYDFWGVLDYILETIMKSAFRFAVRLYIWERMDNVKLIDYPEWGMIPLIETHDVVKMTVPEIHHLYWEYKRKQESKYPAGRGGKKKYIMQDKLVRRAQEKKRKRKK